MNLKQILPPEYIWSSTLKRASETASVLAKTIGCPIQLDEALMEYNNGVQAGLTFEEAKKYPAPQYMHDSYESGESYIEFRMRVETIFSKNVNISRHSRIAIFVMEEL